MTYVGVCYDGPLEGQSVNHGCRKFPVARHRFTLAFDPNEYVSPTCPIDYYRWSQPLRKWVF